MADYYPLIARAIEGLSEQSAQMRASIYERARTALLEQLTSLDPPLSEADIDRERLSLDDAMARVEMKYDPGLASPPTPAQFALPASPQEEDVDLPAAAAPLPPAPAASYSPRVEDDFEDAQFEEVVEDEALGPARPRVDSRAPVVRSRSHGRSVALGSIIALVVGLIAVAAWYLRDMPREPAAAPQVAEAPKPTPAPDANNGSKINERVGGGPPLSAPAAGPVRQEVGVAQRAVLYEEDPAHPQAPRTQVGRVVWRLEGVNAGQGQPLETAVRAVVEFPEAGLTMNLLLRRNLDATLPASHTFELNFTTRQGEPGRVVRDVGVLQFKNEEGARGTPVAGLPVPVRENLFLIGLSNLNSDVERNIELLVRRNWIDLPVRLASGQRAIISFEKGVAGDQVMSDAFRQWQ